MKQKYTASKGKSWSADGEGEAAGEACFHQALVAARRDGARSLELRTALSLSRLWQRQGKRTAAYELLQDVYSQFTEGWETADLQEAKQCLEDLETVDTALDGPSNDTS